MAAIITNVDRPRASSRRRTQRVSLFAAVECSGKDAEKAPFTISVAATRLNAHGAMIHLNRDLPLHSVVVLKNSRGARIPARVVAQTSVAANQFGYGIEFVETENASDFWGINFPARQR